MKFILHRYYLLLTGFVLLLFFLNAYNLTFNFKPSAVHQWRQSDCLSITKNYSEEGMHFFESKIHSQTAIEGRAVSEMPLINYTVAGLWRLFGESEGIYRLFNYLIFITSIFVLFRTFLNENNSGFVSFCFVSILLTSPLLVYYGFNFLADVPALSIAIIAFCSFLKFYRTKKISFFYLSLLFATLAVLLKASASLPLGLLFVFYVIDYLKLNKHLQASQLFTKPLLPGISLVIGGLICYLWYHFAKEYDLKNNCSIFLIGVLPIWEMSEKSVLANFSALFSDQFAVFLNRPMLFLFFFCILYVVFNFKQLDYVFKVAFLVSATFFVSYILLFFQVFDVHDYYLINLMIFTVITLFCLANILNKQSFSLKGRKWLATSIVVLITFNSLYSAAFYRMRTIKDDKIVSWYPFLSPDEKEKNDLIIWRYQKTMASLETIQPELRKLGIKREDRFISVPDISPNSSLYLMDQKGFTLSAKDFLKDTLWKGRSHYRSSDYMVISDSTLKDSLTYQLIYPELESVYKKFNVEVYKIKKN